MNLRHCGTAILTIVTALVFTANASISTAQLHADWLSQKQLRNIVPGHKGQILPHQDAAGACDGITDGRYGCHTAVEEDPWWQIDLGRSTPIDRIVIYDHYEFADRSAALDVLLSNDAVSFRRVHDREATASYGSRPWAVKLDGETARYVRIRKSGRTYLNLDEVEIYRPGHSENIALQMPATQSSISEWSAWHIRTDAQEINRVVNSGLKLAASLEELGVDVDEQRRQLKLIQYQIQDIGDLPSRLTLDPLYIEARSVIRKMVLANPLLDFDSILFAKRVPPSFPHMSDQYYGWWSRPGGGIYVLENFKSDSPNLRCLTDDWPTGSYLRPDLSYDGKKVVFAYCRFYPHVSDIKDKVTKSNLPEDAFYSIYEMNIDGTGVRRLTRGKYDDFDARYLPDGDIVFLSTRKGQAISVCKATAAATNDSDLPDSYVRCGGDEKRPVPVFTLHRIDGDGRNIRPISAFENFEWTPSVADDGRVLYTRWDYIDRFNGPTISLWSTNTDGTNGQLVYGNFTEKPQCVFEARSIPNSHKLIMTAGAHHSNVGGSLALFDRNMGTEFERPLTRLTPEVCFPETEGWPDHYYANPYPLSEDHYLVAWSDRRLPGHSRITDPDKNPLNPLGIYLYDAFGNLELLHRDPDIGSMYPLPIRSRTRPPVQPLDSEPEETGHGAFLVQDVYQGMRQLDRGSVKHLRIIAVPPKPQPRMNQPNLGVSKEDPGKFVLGTVPVESDGSAHFSVPAGVPVFFQALDENGLAVQTMRSLTYVQSGQTLSCVGCHESRDATPLPGNRPLAAKRGPSKIKLGPEGSWPLRYDRIVQPVLDKHCVSCHSPESSDKVAAKFDLTEAGSYNSLISFADGDLRELAFEKDRSLVGECPSANSKLLELLTKRGGHQGIELDAESYNRLVTWMDTYAHRQGHFSPEQEQQLIAFRREMAPILTSD